MTMNTDHILKLAEIIREVDGGNRLGAAALAEAILSHPGSRWSPAVKPVPVSERRPWLEDCDAEGECYWFDPAGTGAWYLDTYQGNYTHWLPHRALPVPQP